jgi:dienelactone hydrolase
MRPLAIEEREFVIEDESDALRTIRGRISYPAGAETSSTGCAFVLVLHGFKGFMDWGFYPELTRRLVEAGLGVVRFNFSGSGHGARPLEFTEERAFFENTPSRELEDVERVRAWLEARAVPWLDLARGALLGHSLGGAVALIHAADRLDYRAVVAWASVSTFRRFPPEVEAQWRRQGFIEIPNVRTKEVHRLGLGWLEDQERHPRRLDVHGACRRMNAPVLFLHGSHDEAVPTSEGESLYRACAPGLARWEVLPGANHTFGATHPLPGITSALEHVLSRTREHLVAHLL